MDIQRAKQLINLMEAKGLSELELEGEDFKIKLAKANFSDHGQHIQKNPKSSGLPHPSNTKKESEFIELTSSLVGFFYRTGSPGKPPYVKAGDKVSIAQPVCAIEVMGTMHEVASEVEGEIAGVLVENGQAVEYGQVLFLIKPKGVN